MLPADRTPSHAEPGSIDELIADARRIRLPEQATAPAARPEPPALVIPPDSVSLVEGYADYGA